MLPLIGHDDPLVIIVYTLGIGIGKGRRVLELIGCSILGNSTKRI